MERQQSPASLHLSVMPHHAGAVADRFLLDLRACVDNVRRKGGRAVARKGKAAIYQGGWVGGLWSGGGVCLLWCYVVLICFRLRGGCGAQGQGGHLPGLVGCRWWYIYMLSACVCKNVCIFMHFSLTN